MRNKKEIERKSRVVEAQREAKEKENKMLGERTVRPIETFDSTRLVMQRQIWAKKISSEWYGRK
jgi:hypothetical protein